MAGVLLEFDVASEGRSSTALLQRKRKRAGPFRLRSG